MAARSAGAGFALVAAALLGFGPAPASADPGRAEVRPVTAAELADAVAAAHTPAAERIAVANLRRGGPPASEHLDVAASGVPAYTLDPGFVRGDPGAPPGLLAYVAVVATAPGGERTTMEVEPGPTGWTVGAALSGDDEQRLAHTLPPDAVLLREPQINGWYALTGSGVRLLQASLPQNPVGAEIPLALYQQQVHERYADKMPGSTYQRNGGIGFRQQPTSPPAPARPPLWLLPIGAAVLLLAGAVLWWRRRSREPAPARENSLVRKG
ncbi:hypothetical protein [Amycolatopsis sp. PS_44_ISF1]|uniref:hypothetical protein n=1 Tax=Amycolatopsis sp. PS_44_ISF1 TaxID=2974917 RepID=UPI0028DD7B91|nr:hypothetical protein [Amycolatopsis sp. PS_44_ISF1]MDT8910129.1 hypothetical protein [Amycolatopsis sp. PS_44_ISF1]